MSAAASFPCNFRLGQKVVCVDGTGELGADWLGDAPQEGTVYTIRHMMPSHEIRNGVQMICLYFEEIKRGVWCGDELGYWHVRFRALEEGKKQTDISWAHKILERENKRQKERA